METIGVMLTAELAKKMDNILKQASENDDPFVMLSYKDKAEENEYIGIFGTLEQMGLGNSLNRYEFQVYPDGISFLHNGGFTHAYNEKQEQQKRERRQDELTQALLKAEKRQPYLIAWGVVTTISTLILAWLQLCKS